MTRAYYDGHAEWYEQTFATGESAQASRETAVRLLGPGPGRLLDVGCGTGAHSEPQIIDLRGELPDRSTLRHRGA